MMDASRDYLMLYVCMVITYGKSEDQPDKVANSARGQLNKEHVFSLSPFALVNLVSRDGFGSPVQRPPGHLHTQTQSSTTYGNPPDVCGGIHLLIQTAIRH